MPPWLTMTIGLAAIAVSGHYLMKLDEKLHPDRDQRRSSWWVWAICGAMVIGGGAWVLTHPSNEGSGFYDRFEDPRAD